MATSATTTNGRVQDFNILVIGQGGRVGYEALLFVSSLRQNDPGFPGRVIVAEPQPGPLWKKDPRLSEDQREALEKLDAEIVPFDSAHFGQDYPNGNKIEGLATLPPGEPFVFFDSDTIVTDRLSRVPFDFTRPSASMRREGTWPTIELYGPGYTEIWKSLYDRFGLEFDSTMDLSEPDEYWGRYLYFNAGWFFGADPAEFGRRYLDTALAIRDDRPEALVCQEIFPWLDQIALPLVIHGLGGGRPGPDLAGLDGNVTCHWRVLPLAYAREADATIAALEAAAAPNKVKKVLKNHEPMLRMIYQGRGHKARELFDRADLPRAEKVIRNQLKREGFWMR
ncbi:hypothetical protein [Maritimibacter sp. UBA3975]|mgnify:CR=1 FL=1|uniref:hypothetical protein n=1 Tax=Maritimibacter sp. UBA3975 TaxID=1946833 RepID=UPI000C0AB714|nr:hypothetical protein [Maritimibacter sp. UBA3975]MAM60296.1 hypothetical protein [Maritimibacter sp.]|tara:strand:+ start:43368 stop:44381 length:1014 start_codon:yes stop_codon:yes gene_type:complete